MQRSKKITFISLAVMAGIVIGLVLASGFDMTSQIQASDIDATNADEAPVIISQNDAEETYFANLEQTSRTFVSVVKKVKPAIVTITSKQTVEVQNPWSSFFGEEFLRQFGGQSPQNRQQVRHGLGSGVIVNANGYIVTNNHVVADADELLVIIDGEEYEATVVGTDPHTDVAVVKIDKKNLPFIKLGDSDRLEVGEIVLAIGSPFSEELEHSVTQGIVSAKGRKGLPIGGRDALSYQDFIQTDAAINPGNSGGGLVNLRGELIGINTAIIGQTNVGIGFAIPVNLVKWVKDQLVNEGSVTRGYIGVSISTPDRKMAKAFGLKEARGALVQSVEKGMPADKAGLKAGDVITAVNEKVVKDHLELMNLIAQYRPGEAVRLDIFRDGDSKRISVKLAKRPGTDDIVSATEKTEKSSLGLQVEAYDSEVHARFEYPENYGVIVTRIDQDSPAAEQGLRRGDLILEYGRSRQKIKSAAQFYEIIDSAEAGDVLLFRIRNVNGALFLPLEIPAE